MPRYINTVDKSYILSNDYVFFKKNEIKDTNLVLNIENTPIKLLNGIKIALSSQNVLTNNITQISPNLTLEFIIYIDSFAGILTDTLNLFDTEAKVHFRINATHYLIFTIISENGTVSVQSISPLEINKYYKVAGTYDGSKIKLYMGEVGKSNITLEDEDDLTGDIDWQSVLILTVGGETTGVAEGDGVFSIYDIKLWDITKSIIVLNNTMTESLNGDETGLQLYWNFIDGSGATVFDVTPNNNDGTIDTAAWETGLEPSIEKTIEIILAPEETVIHEIEEGYQALEIYNGEEDLIEVRQNTLYNPVFEVVSPATPSIWFNGLSYERKYLKQLYLTNPSVTNSVTIKIYYYTSNC